MTIAGFYEEASRVLLPASFEFLLSRELRHAVRSQEFLTFVTFETAREWEGMSFVADSGTLREMAQIISDVVRDTDLVGRCEEGTLALVLLHSGFEHAIRVIDRLAGRIEEYQFSATLRIAIGAACFPAHAVDVASLKRQAASRPIVNLRGRVAPAPDQDGSSPAKN